MRAEIASGDVCAERASCGARLMSAEAAVRGCAMWLSNRGGMAVEWRCGAIAGERRGRDDSGRTVAAEWDTDLLVGAASSSERARTCGDPNAVRAACRVVALRLWLGRCGSSGADGDGDGVSRGESRAGTMVTASVVRFARAKDS